MLETISNMEFLSRSRDFRHMQNLREKIERGQVDERGIAFSLHSLRSLCSIHVGQKEMEKGEREKIVYSFAQDLHGVDEINWIKRPSAGPALCL